MASPEDIARRREVSRVKSSMEQELLQLPNVTGVFTGQKVTDGRDTGEVAIVVTVSEKKDVPAKDRIPEEINGVKTDVIEEVIEPKVASAVRVEDMAPMVDTGTYTPMQGGISIGPCRSIYMEPPDVDTAGNYVFVGTLGCIVRDNATSDLMMLSNFHVMCVDDTWSAGDDIAQPSRVDGGSCPGDQVGALVRAQLNASVDAAVASIDERDAECSIVEIGDVEGTGTAAVDMAVRKRGRTTELTFGRVTATDYTTNVDYGDGLGVVRLTNQIRIERDAARSTVFGQSGDSGSVVVDEDNNVVGLYFAGNQTGTVGVANPIAAVLSEMNVSICTGGKLLKEDLRKELHKEYSKRELKELKEFSKREIKELDKELRKEYIKDWKEYAYEKPDIYEGGMPWEWDDVVNPPVVERPPVVGGVRPPGGIGGLRPPGGVGGLRPPVRGFGGWSPALTGQTQRIRQGARRSGERGGSCVDFACVETGGDMVVAPPFYLTVLDYNGNPMPTEIVSWGAHTGLSAGWTVEIKIDGYCPIVQATLVHFSAPATMEAWSGDGSYAGSATMTDVQDVTQTLTIEGIEVTYVRITAPQDETILLSLCCCANLLCGTGEERQAIAKPDQSEYKAYKEFKEPKEFKEWGKDLKEKEFKERLPKEWKEWKEDPKEIYESGPRQPGDVGHFIPPTLRPDLSRGALRQEPGSHRPRRGGMRRRG